MPFATLPLILTLNAVAVFGHGTIIRVSSGGIDNTPWLVYNDKYKNPVPQRFTREYATNGPITDVNSLDLRCNANQNGTTNSPAPLQNLKINGGDEVEFGWDTWPASHKGPVMTYLARCPSDDCTNWDGSGDVWFKVQGDGLLDAASGTWAASNIATDGLKSSFKMPSDLASGAYIMRHELLALHSAQNISGAQFYPSCHQMTLTSTGTLEPKGYAIPGIYKADDPGILINIYYPAVTSYQIPGPPLYSEDSSNENASSVVNANSSTSTVQSAVSSTESADTLTAALSASTVIDTSVSSLSASATSVPSSQAKAVVATNADDDTLPYCDEVDDYDSSDLEGTKAQTTTSNLSDHVTSVSTAVTSSITLANSGVSTSILSTHLQSSSSVVFPSSTAAGFSTQQVSSSSRHIASTSASYAAQYQPLSASGFSIQAVSSPVTLILAIILASFVMY